MYDLAKEMSKNGRVLMIHCGMLSEGHRILNEIMENVDIISEADIISANVNVDGYQPQAYYVPGADSIIKHQFILVDEAQRMSENTLELIKTVTESTKNDVKVCVFSYD